MLVTRDHLAHALVDEVEAMGSRVLVEHVLIDDIDLGFQEPAYFHDEIWVAVLEELDPVDKILVNHERDFLLETHRKILDYFVLILELLEGNSEIFEVVLDFLAEMIRQVSHLGEFFALLKLLVVLHVLFVDD